MANNNNRINIQVGYTVDKSGLQEMQSLFQQIANRAKEPGNKLDQGLQQAAKTANVLDGILEKTFNTNLGTLNVTKFNQELAKSNLTLKDVQSSFAQVGNIGTTAYNKLAQSILGTNQQIKQTSQVLDKMAITFKNTIRYGISSSIFNNLTGAIERAYSYSRDLDTSLNDIRIVTDKSADSMDKFAQKANQAAKNLGASTLDYANASLIYYQQGLSDAEVSARAETTIKAANVTGQTGEEVSEQLTAVWNGYKVTAEETEAYVDKLAAVAATTAADLEELSIGMSKVASAANAMGVNFDDLNAQIATIVSVTRQAPESVGTALKTIYARLGDLKVDGVDEFGTKLGDVSKQLEIMGINILDQQGNLRDMSSVITEVAGKWNTWTEAQRQAAAVAMAGKRQYNNLIALFDNWDMYTDALNTSTEAIGTLQHQQDIYLESTEAKLKTLKATWQDLYGDLIDEDELNDSIELLTNFVQTFDNFIESFGGGLKSISALGAVVSSIFNKQIAESISNASQRVQVFKNNLELAKSNAEIRNLDVLNNSTLPKDIAAAENTKIQLEYAQKIYDVRTGLNQEQANLLVGYQKEIGQLTEEIALNEQLLNKKQSSTMLTEEEIQALKTYNITIDDIYNKQNIIEENIEKTLISLKRARTEEEAIEQTVKNLSELFNSVSQKIQESVLEETRFKAIIEAIQDDTLNVATREEDILDLIQQITEKQKQENKNTEDYLNILNKVRDTEEKRNNIKQEAEGMLEIANNAKSVVQQVTMVTSALGSMAMAWSSLNSLIQTWNDKSASVGDKITQTLMTLGMTIPIVISNFAKLNEVLDISSIFLTKNAAQKTANTLATEAETAANIASTASRKAENAEIEAQIALKSILLNANGGPAARVTELMAEVSARKLNIASLEEEMGVAILKSVADEKNLHLNQKELVYIYKDIAAKNAKVAASNAEIAATKAATASQEAFNIALTANPIGLVIAAISGLALVLGGLYGVYQNVQQAAKEEAEEALENANNLKIEKEANDKLIKSYEELYEQYQKGKSTKEDLKETVDKLVESYGDEIDYIAFLTEDYDKLSESIQNAIDKENDQLQLESKRSIKSSAKSAVQQGRDAWGLGLYGNTLKANFNTLNADNFIGSNGEDLNQQVQDIFNNTLGAIDNAVSIDKNSAREVIEFYDNLIEVQEQLKDLNQENTSTYDRVTKMIDALNAEGDIDNLKKQADSYIKDTILNTSGLEKAIDQADFNSIIKSIREQIQDGINEGILSSDTNINDIIDNYVKGLDSELAKKFILTEEVFNTWDQIPLKKVKEITDKLSSDELQILLNLDINPDSEEEVEEALKEITERYKEQLGTESNPLASSLINEIQKGEVTSSNIEENEEYSKLIENLEKLKEIYPEITAETEILNHTELVGTQEYIEALEQAQNLLNELELQGSIREAKENIDEILNEDNTLKIKADTEEFNEKLKDILDAEYDINVKVHTEAEQEFNSIENAFSSLDTMASKIDESFKVSASDLRELNNTFPGILQGMQTLSDGTIQLNENVVQSAMASAEAEMQADAQATIEKLNNQATLLEQKQAIYESMAQAALLLSQSETDASIDTTEQQRILADGLANIKAIDSQTTANSEMKNDKEVADSANVNGAAIAQSGESAFNAWAEASYQAAQTAIQNLNAVKTVAEGGNASAVKGSVNVNYNGSSGVDKEASILEAVSSSLEGKNTTSAQYAQQAAGLQAAADAVGKQANDIRGMIAQIGAGATTLDKKIGNVASGKGPKGNPSNGKNKKDGGEKRNEKYIEDEIDRYYKLNEKIEDTEDAIKKLDKAKEHAYGKEKIKLLEKENELLKKQKKNYRDLLKAQKDEQKDIRSALKGFGAKFDKQGNITNYKKLNEKNQAAYNKQVDRYNAGKIDKDTLDAYKKRYEQFKDMLKKYEDIEKNIRDTEDKITDKEREIIEANFEKWELKITVKLDLIEAERHTKEFIKEISEDFKRAFPDNAFKITQNKSIMETYTQKKGTLDQDQKLINDTITEINKLKKGKKSDRYETLGEAQKQLKEYRDQYEDDVKSVMDLAKESWEAYLDALDQVADSFDFIRDRVANINEELEFQKEMMELIYGEEVYDEISAIYKVQKEASLTNISSLKEERDLFKQIFEDTNANMDDRANWTEEQTKAYEAWQEAEGNLRDSVKEHIQLLKEDYSNTVNQIIKNIEESTTNGIRVSDAKDNWEKMQDYAERYYDDVERSYQIQKYSNKIDQDIAKTNNLKIQQKLKKFRDTELQQLQEKKELNEDDLKIAEAEYEILQKQIALEESRNKKNSIKLVRNEQGNWSYQYVADQSDILSKQQELSDAWNDYYQTSQNAYNSTLNKILDLEENYQSKLKEIANSTIYTEEEKNQKLQELNEWYFTNKDALVEDSTYYEEKQIKAFFGMAADQYKNNQKVFAESFNGENKDSLIKSIEKFISDGKTDFQGLTDFLTKDEGTFNTIKKVANEAIGADGIAGEWKTQAQNIAGYWAGNKDSIKEKITAAVGGKDSQAGDGSLCGAMKAFDDEVLAAKKTSGLAFGKDSKDGKSVYDVINSAKGQVTELQGSITTLVSKAKNKKTGLPALNELVKTLYENWEKVAKNAEDAEEAIEKALKAESKNNSKKDTKDNKNKNKDDTPATQPAKIKETNKNGGGNNNSSGSNNSSGGGRPSSRNTKKTNDKSKKVINDTYTVTYLDSSGKSRTYATTKGFEDAKKFAKQVDWSLKNQYVKVTNNRTGKYMVASPTSKNFIDKWVKFKTGGYTGDWNDNSGRWAMLHQKELVLNKEDTKNFLNGINMIRDMSSLNGSISNSIAKAVANMMVTLSSKKVGNLNSGTEENTSNVFNITAEFPNAENVNEIRQAILSLPNIASQVINEHRL